MPVTPPPATGAPLLSRIRSEPVYFLMAMSFVNFLGFAGWTTLFNNFAKEAAGFTGADIGLAQTVREIPGFLAFTAIYFFLVLREQTFGYLALIVLGGGLAITGYFPSLTGLLVTTFIMSVGFHYFETVNQSLSLQLFPKKEAPRLLGRVASANAAAQFLVYSGIALLWWSGLTDYGTLFAIIGLACIVLTLAAFVFFARFDGTVAQVKTIVIRPRYWLYYALTFMNGARRQIFSAFAGFLLVEKFGFKVPDIALLMLATAALNTYAAPRLGALVGRWGERRTIAFENISLILIFLGYAFVTNGWVAAGLYVADGVFSILVLAQKTYIQKIGDPADMAPTAACAFTINHIAAVVIPVTFGLLWLKNPSFVFMLGAAIATTSLALSFLVPRHPGPGNETVLVRNPSPAAAE
ncbi:MAG: MFS transporter [Hyphomicrobiales bacterium]|uniref:MFS transporter n=1 Tax=Rhabdaerophilum calidifontis TaxID=2604328 RepID=UPI00123A4DA1|nr:MFS transporter [Rhabdaerophilum calidifontis]MCA1999733.1 MFS transporter [Hyphomicrobiales bacterium]